MQGTNVFYKLKDGETWEAARRRWTYFLINDLSRKMGAKALGGEVIVTIQKVLDKFPDNSVWTFFEEAPTKFKYFPKPVEVKDGIHEINRSINKTQGQTQQLQDEDCDWCDDAGFVIMEDAKGYRLTCYCTHCNNGSARKSQTPSLLAAETAVNLKYKPVRNSLQNIYTGKRSLAPKSPWPASIVGLIMGLDDPRGLSPYGMRALDIDKDQAKYLYDCWKKQDWSNEWALEIIAKRRRSGPLSEILNTSI